MTKLNWRLLAVGALAASLGGCASLQNAYNVATGASVTPNQVYILANAFDAAENTAKAYDSLPLCSAGVSYACRTLAGVQAVDRAVRTGRAARNQLEAYVNANPGSVVPVSGYNALVVAINTIQSYVTPTGAAQ